MDNVYYKQRFGYNRIDNRFPFHSPSSTQTACDLDHAKSIRFYKNSKVLDKQGLTPVAILRSLRNEGLTGCSTWWSMPCNPCHQLLSVLHKLSYSHNDQDTWIITGIQQSSYYVSIISKMSVLFMVCLEHFNEDWFKRLFHMEKNVRRLEPGSIPTVWRYLKYLSIRRSHIGEHRSHCKVRIECCYYFIS